jgi:hypothetical protein
MSRDHRSVWQRGARLWAVAPLLAALLLTLASVAVAADGELPSGHVTPAFGPAAGGTAVAISGSGSTGATDVTFGGGAATNVPSTATARRSPRRRPRMTWVRFRSS